ncbi:hypothetical protein GR328_23400, partial [Microvirga makkahensis]|nr:hypothetical protein [Microvirga makkahensis]
MARETQRRWGVSGTIKRSSSIPFIWKSASPPVICFGKIDVFVTQALAGIHREPASFYSHTGRPSIDPELMMRMLIVGYCYGIRSERKLCEEVSRHLAYRWFRRLDLDDAAPD